MAASDGAAVSHGDSILVLFRGGYVRDHRAFHDDANMNLTFSTKTGTSSISIPLGTLKADLDAPLPYQNFVLLPPTPIYDHFSIIVGMIQESELKKAQDSISSTLTPLVFRQ
ncbi:MAG: hypothetical protein ABI361_06635 [Nitrososphaera sp.]